MKTTDNYMEIIAKRIATKVNENDIKTVIPIVMPISKEFIGYLNMDNIVDNKPNELYVRFMRQYDNLHRCCPKCGSYKYEATLLGYVFNEEHPEQYKDKNRCTCLQCGWKGIYDDRVPDIKIYPKPYYIHKKTGNRYCKVTDKDNFMFKENGEWKRGLVLYKTMYWNDDGEYFARTKEDFEDNFIEEDLYENTK